MHNAYSGSSVVVQQGWGESVPAKNRVSFLPHSPKCLVGAFSEVPTNLSRFSARSHISLLVIVVIRARPDEEGDRTGAGTE
jgi:hypothetical protein